jgi:hypothetical protein
VIVSSLPLARTEIARLRAGFVILDLELLSYSEVKKLCAEFPSVVFTSVHRLADESMWLQSLAVGAVDCCQSNDVRGLLRASERCASTFAAVA